jgi:hypothetical protein
MGDNTMSYPLAILLASVLILGAVLVILYTVKRMKNEFEKSMIAASDEDADH